MSREIRAVTEEEWPSFVRTVHTAFGHVPRPDDTTPEQRQWPIERSVAVFDDGAIVAGAGAFSMELTVPGGATLPAAGVTWVAVLPTHTRRGALRSMMEHQLDDVHERGEPVAVLLASESLIYGRFGYGLATTHADYELDRRHATLAVDAGERGHVTLVDDDAARKLLPEVFDRVRRATPGEVSRPDGWWEEFFRHNKPSGGANSRFFALHESAGEADGYVYYRVRNQGVDAWGATLEVEGLGALDAGAYTDLWRYVADVDLTWKVVAKSRPVDEPLRWMLADPRRLAATSTADFLWVRLVDLPAALAARRYSTTDRLVVEVSDDTCPWNAGRWAIEAAGDGDASCDRTDGAADVACSAADLGAAYLGGVSFSTLARAGRVGEERAGALRRADLLFSTPRAPWCSTAF